MVISFSLNHFVLLSPPADSHCFSFTSAQNMQISVKRPQRVMHSTINLHALPNSSLRVYRSILWHGVPCLFVHLLFVSHVYFRLTLDGLRFMMEDQPIIYVVSHPFVPLYVSLIYHRHSSAINITVRHWKCRIYPNISIQAPALRRVERLLTLWHLKSSHTLQGNTT